MRPTTISCNSTYRLRYWNPLNPLNLADLPSVSVATVLTVYGIETLLLPLLFSFCFPCCNSTYRLRYWNLRSKFWSNTPIFFFCNNNYHLGSWNSKVGPLRSFAALCCNSTYRLRYWNIAMTATIFSHNIILLQQYLPFTVLKLDERAVVEERSPTLQQYLPFTVLKPPGVCYISV